MVRAPRSAHIAVAPAPATTKTVTIGPIWRTVPSAAPVPEKSAAPISVSRMVSMKVSNTVYGMVNISVGTNRHPRDEPRLGDEFAPRKGRLEHPHERVERHRVEAAECAHGLGNHIGSDHQRVLPRVLLIAIRR